MDTPMRKITNPHDKLFRETWSDPATVRSFLQHYLPAAVLSIADLSSLEICKDSFVEKELREYFSDMLYKVNLSDCPGYLYILFEHKSYHEKWIHLQLLEYMLKIWRQSMKRDKRAGLPVVIPLVLYHGKKPWPSDGIQFSSLLSGPTDVLSAYIPDFRFIMHDLARFSDDQIKGTIMARVVMMMYKYIFDPHLTEKLPGIFSLMRELMEKDTGLQHLEAVLRYLFNAVDHISTDDIKSIVAQSLSDREGDFIMTLAERLQKEGFEKGVQQGMRRGIQQGMQQGRQQGVQQGIQQGVQQGIQQGMQQGILEGLMEGIEMAVSLKFPEEAFRVMPLIHQMKTIAQLKAVKEAIMAASSASEFIEKLK
jgi:predicted transposase/invertase (TIGR01784 family)